MNRHPHGCVCEGCFGAAAKGAQAPAERAMPSTRAEYLADIDRAFNAGVKIGQERAQRSQRAREIRRG